MEPGREKSVLVAPSQLTLLERTTNLRFRGTSCHDLSPNDLKVAARVLVLIRIVV